MSDAQEAVVEETSSAIATSPSPEEITSIILGDAATLPEADASLPADVINVAPELDAGKTLTVVSNRNTVQALRLELLPTGVRLHLGKGLTKIVDPAELIRALQEAYSTSNTSVEQEIKFPVGLLYFSQSVSTIKISFFYPEHVEPVTYRSDRRPRILPNIIITHRLFKQGEAWEVSETRYFATNRPRDRVSQVFHTLDHPEVCPLPTTNIYETARMCYGENPINHTHRQNDFRGLHAFFSLIGSAPFNDDLGLYALPTNSPYRVEYSTGIRKWFDLLASRAEAGLGFPYEELAKFR